MERTGRGLSDIVRRHCDGKGAIST
jgi:hypothetical protein